MGRSGKDEAALQILCLFFFFAHKFLSALYLPRGTRSSIFTVWYIQCFIYRTHVVCVFWYRSKRSQFGEICSNQCVFFVHSHREIDSETFFHINNTHNLFFSNKNEFVYIFFLYMAPRSHIKILHRLFHKTTCYNLFERY